MSALRYSLAAWATIIVGLPIVILACVGDQNGSYVDSTDTPAGGQSVNPNIVNCGSLDAGCNTSEENSACCAGPGVSGGATCIGLNDDGGPPCPLRTGTVFCNETADCDVPNFCCGTILTTPDAGGNVSTRCEPTCPAPKIQFCRTNGECTNHQRCVVQKCSDGLIYEMCGVFSPPGAAFTCKAQ